MNHIYRCPITKTRFFVNIFSSNNKPTYTISHIDLSLNNTDLYLIKNVNVNVNVNEDENEDENASIKCKKCDGIFPSFNSNYEFFSNECFVKHVKNYMIYHQL